MAAPIDIQMVELDRNQSQQLLDASATQPKGNTQTILGYMPTRETCNKMICWRCKMWMLIVSTVAMLTAAITIIVILSIRATPLDDELIDPNLKIHGTPRYYIGSIKISNYSFTPGLMVPQSKNLTSLSKTLKHMLNQLYTTSPALRYYFVDSDVFSFSHSGAIAYFWLQFALPKEKDLLIKYTLSTEVLINVLRQHLQTADVGRIMKIELSSLMLRVANEEYVQSLKTGQCVHHVLLLSEEQTFDSLGLIQCNRSSSSYWLVQGGIGYSIKATISTQPGGTTCNGVDVATYSTGFLDPKQTVSKFEQTGQPLTAEVIVSGDTLLVAFNPTAGCNLLQYSITFLQVPVTECGGVLGGTKGSFRSPRDSNNQEKAVNCTWNLKVQEHFRTKIVFKDFKLGGSPKTGESCVTDYLEVDSRRFCGDHQSFCLYSNSSSLQILFHANQINSKGFAADYMAIDDDLDANCH
ncbi:suppressor of tumorigenicity 14 protein homolog isoform X1 [Hypanus sabinus]|uniref:suppressor of tumorigenicity 14 protein homolog isoform X1 n=1 Tax=Hypanus sabinus TaxID=79690 RepID=UPI0028C4329D|nr:suppressor of tumorigenicity 14 protein homolog isoform X1 [Hypanus sabinus]